MVLCGRIELDGKEGARSKASKRSFPYFSGIIAFENLYSCNQNGTGMGNSRAAEEHCMGKEMK